MLRAKANKNTNTITEINATCKGTIRYLDPSRPRPTAGAAADREAAALLGVRVGAGEADVYTIQFKTQNK